MKNINTYIIEKLHLNKDIEVDDPDVAKVVGKILALMTEDTMYKTITPSDLTNLQKIKFIKITIDWVIDNNVKDFTAYCDNINLDDWKVKKKIKSEFTDDSKVINKYTSLKNPINVIHGNGITPITNKMYIEDNNLIYASEQTGYAPLIKIFVAN